MYLSYVVTIKSTVEISQNFVAFSEYMSFNRKKKIKEKYRIIVGDNELNTAVTDSRLTMGRKPFWMSILILILMHLLQDNYETFKQRGPSKKWSEGYKYVAPFGILLVNSKTMPFCVSFKIKQNICLSNTQLESMASTI